MTLPSAAPDPLSPDAQVTPALLPRLHRENFAAVYRYAYWRLGEGRAAQEATIGAFGALLDASRRGRVRVAAVPAWLLAEVGRRITAQTRRAAPSTDPIRAALRRLAPGEQHFLGLRFGAGCALDEIAALLRLTPAAAKQRQARALNAFRRAQQRRR
jgi:hypothetical protein